MSSNEDVDQEELKRLREERKKAKEAAKAAKAAKAKAKKPQWNQPADKGEGKGKKEKEIRLKTAFVNETPEGEKKVPKELAAAYDPPSVEAAWYSWWEKQGFHTPEYVLAHKGDQLRHKDEGDDEAAPGERDGRFVMMIPPPNVTGFLHIGHALTNSIQDALVRWRRMRGVEALWVPGMDHAGIATQSVVERMLWKSAKTTKDDLGRDAFIAKVWEWKNDKGGRITQQLRRLGSSLDWNREVFTMDERLSRAVTEAFVRLHEKGLIYRAQRLVNWSCALRTAISDLEVDDEELEGPTLLPVPGHAADKKYEFGKIWSFAYKLVPEVGKDDSEAPTEIVIATTRPETMLGDVAVAVHPEDARYKSLHGRRVQHPFVNRTLPIITDAVLVDMAFGTGAVKITPAHDQNDFATGERHNLPSITVIDTEGRMNEEAGEFKGMMRFDARETVLKRLEELGLSRGWAPNKMRLGKCSRSGDIIEPLLKPQWYVDTSDMAARATAAVREKKLVLTPERQEKQWFYWLEHPQPWCISRQLWWGHRIPAYRVLTGEAGKELWVAARSETEAQDKAKALLGSDTAFTLQQDPDVLDTWFSSGLFPFSSFGWPEQTPDLQRYYPTSLLETGQDILFFWVARMVMLGQELTGQLPFTEVLLHTMVRDAHGRKMSKALGNVIDPIDVIEGITLEDLHAQLAKGNLREDEVERAKLGQKQDFPNGISECGTDALRFTLCGFAGQTRDMNLDINRVVNNRHLCNKLWQASKFALNILHTHKPVALVDEPSEPEHAGAMDKWILSRLNATEKAVDASWRKYELGEVTTALETWWVHDLCDVYLEAIKGPLRDKAPELEHARNATRVTLYTCLEEGLRLLAPLMPFLAEELWQRLPRRPDEKAPSIHVAAYPRARASRADAVLEEAVTHARSVVNSVRSVAAAHQVNIRAKQPRVTLVCAEDGRAATLKELLGALLPATGMKMSDGQLGVEVDASMTKPPPKGCATVLVDHATTLHMHLGGVVDAAAEVKKLEKRHGEIQAQLEDLATRMAAPDYARVPAEVQAKEAEKKARLEGEQLSAEAALKTFRSLAEEDSGKAQ